MHLSRFLISLITGIVVLCSGTPVGANEENKPVLSLQEAIHIAITNNALIKEAIERQMAALEEEKSAKADFFPKASAHYLYTGLTQEPITKTGSTETQIAHKNQYHWDVTLVQPLFTGFGLSSKHHMTKLGIEIKNEEKRQATLDVAQQVKLAYFTLLLSKKMLAVADEEVSALKAHERDAKKFYDHGLIPRNDLLKSQVALAHAMQDRERARANLQMALSHLNTLMDRDMNRETDVEDIASIPETEFDLSGLVEEATVNRPVLKIVYLGIQTLQDNIRLAKSSYYPNVSVAGQYERNGDSLTASDNDFSNEYNTTVMLQMNWTFFEWGKKRADVSKACYNKQALSRKLKGIEDSVRLEIKDAFLNLQVARKNITTANKSLGQAQENWRITNLQYQKQIATSTDVLDARAFLTQAETNYYDSLYGYMISLAELERAVGRM